MKLGKRFAVTFILICALALCSNGILSVVRSSAATDREKYYTSIEIQSGDTLWGYEQQYNTGGQLSASEYIAELKSMNHLTGSTIHAGNYLVVICYR